MSTIRGHTILLDMEEIEIIHLAVENLQKTAHINGKYIHLRSPHLYGNLKLFINKKELVFNADVRRELRSHQLGQIEKMAKMYHPYIIVAERIFPKIKEQLRNQNIAYLEANGNVYFNEKNYHYFIDTQKPLTNKKEKINRAFTKTGLKVLFHFIIKENLINFPHREIADITDVAHGNIAYILQGLRENRFLIKLNKNTYALNNKKELVEKWLVDYKETLQPKLKVGQFRFINNNQFTNWRNIKLQEGKTWWGGEPAGDLLTNYLRPGKLTLYTNEPRNDLLKNYKLIPDPEGDIQVYKKFWDKTLDTQTNTVPTLLVYTDLINMGDKRCRETAEIIYKKYVEPNL